MTTFLLTLLRKSAFVATLFAYVVVAGAALDRAGRTHGLLGFGYQVLALVTVSLAFMLFFMLLGAARGASHALRDAILYHRSQR